MINKGELVAFLIRAKQKTYAGHGAEVESSRPASHDLRYEEDPLLYIDTFLGGAKFASAAATLNGSRVMKPYLTRGRKSMNCIFMAE